MIRILLFCIFLSPLGVFALTAGDYIQQGVTVVNRSSGGILITDPSSAVLQNFNLATGYCLEMSFRPEQFTNSSGQTFVHQVKIISAVNAELICTVTSNLFLSENGVNAKKPSSSNESKCQTSVYLKSDGSNKSVYGFKIIVM
jgi:hypothetical protein